MNRLTRILVLGLAIASTAGFVDCSLFEPTPTLMCSDFVVTLAPGSCRRIANPCFTDWLPPGGSRFEAFALRDAPPVVWTQKVGSLDSSATAWTICAAPNSIVKGDSTVFAYGRDGAFGTGHVWIFVEQPLVLSASATPDHIGPGEASQLVVTASGGIAPYSFSWIPTTGIDHTNIPTPLASPAITTTYTVHVTDSQGLSAEASTTVNVGYEIVVSANPRDINPGDFSQLGASSLGGSPPYSYVWSPTDDLDDPGIPNPASTTRVTRTYTVVSADATGATRTGSVEVRVNLLGSPTAVPLVISPGGHSQLTANFAGGDGHYAYSWSPVDGLTDPTAPDPIASPSATTLYCASVTDGHGVERQDCVRVTVDTGAPLAASFTFARLALDAAAHTIHWTFDASASTGTVASYTWDLAGNDGTMLHLVRNSPVLDVDLPEAAVRGTMTLTVTATDGTSATQSLAYR